MNLGINLVGASYGMFPSLASIDYYAAKGFTQVRLPISWEQVQPTLNGELDKSYIAEIRAIVDHSKSLGITVVLDIHNQGAFNDVLIGSPSVPVSSFANLWGRLAEEFADDSNFLYGLMNEPQQTSAHDWLSAVNAAIIAIREAGGTQQVLVPGIGWTGAWSWTSSDNAKVIGAPGAIVDPANNYAFEVHQYLDDTSGTNEWVVSETIGVERLVAITEWARATGSKLYLGEFGVAANDMSLAALTNMLDYLKANQDVWTSADYWAGGPSWNDYIFGVEPELGLLDAKQMDVLEQYTGATTKFTSMADGHTKVETFLPGSSNPSFVDVMDANDQLVSRSLFDAGGNLDRLLTANASGYVMTDYHVPGQTLPATLLTYNSNLDMVTKTALNADGTFTVETYHEATCDLMRSASFDSKGLPVEQVEHLGSGHVVTKFNNGVVALVEQYSKTWTLEARHNYNSEGVKVSSQFDLADGSHVVEQFNVQTGAISARVEYGSSWAEAARYSFDHTGNLTTAVRSMDDGTRMIEHYRQGLDQAAAVEHLTADYKLISKLVTLDDGSHMKEVYAPPGSHRVSTREVYDADWSLSSRTSFAADGKVASVMETLDNGQFQIASYSASNQNTPSDVTTYTANWAVVSLETYSASGQPIENIDFGLTTGNITVTKYLAGTSQLAAIEVYSEGWQDLISRANYDLQGKLTTIYTTSADGSQCVANYSANNSDFPECVTVYDAAWNTLSRSVFDLAGQLSEVITTNPVSGYISVQVYATADILTKVENYSANWGRLIDRTSYDSNGNIASIQIDNSNGTHTIKTFAASAQEFPKTIDVFSGSWTLASRSYLNEDGLIYRADTHHREGGKTIAYYDIPGSENPTKLVAYAANGDLIGVNHVKDTTFYTQVLEDDAFFPDTGMGHFGELAYIDPIDFDVSPTLPIYDLLA